MNDERHKTRLRPTRVTRNKIVSAEQQQTETSPDQEFADRVLPLLRGAGFVGQAFQRLCNAGCEKHWLEREILLLRLLPFESPRKPYTAEDERKLQRLIKKLDRIAKELSDIEALIMVKTVRRPRTMLPLAKMGQRVTSIANQIREGVENPKWRGFKTFTGPLAWPDLVEQVKQFTGRSHYRDLATLIGAAYGERSFSEDDLKSYVRRAQLRRKGSQGNHASGK